MSQPEIRSGKWRGSVASASRAVALAALLGAGTLFTYRHQQQLGSPGELLRLPAAVINAADPSTEAFRISQVIRKYTRTDSDADRIAKAVVHESNKKNVDPVMVVGIMLVESEMNPRARSFVGARGLMQVMPFHRGKWGGCKADDLYDIETNICHGVSVLAENIKRAPNLRVALQRYNGCVRGTNTPGCHTYSSKVLKARDRTAEQLLTLAE